MAHTKTFKNHQRTILYVDNDVQGIDKHNLHCVC